MSLAIAHALGNTAVVASDTRFLATDGPLDDDEGDIDLPFKDGLRLSAPSAQRKIRKVPGGWATGTGWAIVTSHCLEHLETADYDGAMAAIDSAVALVWPKIKDSTPPSGAEHSTLLDVRWMDGTFRLRRFRIEDDDVKASDSEANQWRGAFPPEYNPDQAAEMFKAFLGPDREPMTLSLKEWNHFIKSRTEGRAGMGGEPVRARAVQRDLRFLLGVLNWAVLRGDGHGGTLLERNPLKGLRLPKEKNPQRVVLAKEEYEALLEVADQVDWRFKVALVLAHETGHRIGAIRQLRWSDINFDEGVICWRASTEKSGYEHVTPMSDQARSALKWAQKESPGIGDAPVLPAPAKRDKPISKYLATSWWNRAEVLAGLAPQRWRGWHSLRRRFASDLMDLPLKLLCTLGGWKSPQTVLECYQHPDQEAMKAALAGRARTVEGRE